MKRINKRADFSIINEIKPVPIKKQKEIKFFFFAHVCPCVRVSVCVCAYGSNFWFILAFYLLICVCFVFWYICECWNKKKKNKIKWRKQKNSSIELGVVDRQARNNIKCGPIRDIINVWWINDVPYVCNFFLEMFSFLGTHNDVQCFHFVFFNFWWWCLC